MRRLYLRKRKFLPFAAAFVLSLALPVMFLCIALSPVFNNLATAGCENHTRAVLYSAVYSVSENEDFSAISETNEQNGKITSISLNAKNTNRIRTLIATKINTLLADEDYSTFSVPVGNLTGIPLLSGRGFKIPLKIVPLGSADADIVSDFSDAGINQTRHSVYVKASVKVRLMTPFSSSVTETTTKIPLTETVIVGDIPHLYAGGSK